MGSKAQLAGAAMPSPLCWRRSHTKPPSRLPRLAPIGTRIITAWDDHTARIWDTKSGKETGVLKGHEKAVVSGSFSPDGKRIVTASEDGNARLWDASSGKQISILKGDESPLRSASFSPDGSRIAGTFFGDGHPPRIWDAISGQQIAVLTGNEKWVTSAVFSPDSKRLATTSFDPHSARIWDADQATNSSSLRDIKVSSAVPISAPMALTSSLGRTIARRGLSNTASGQELAALRPGSIVEGASFSLDGTRIVTVQDDNTAIVWDAMSSKEVVVLRGHRGPVYRARFSPNGARIITVSEDRTARIWHAASGREIIALVGHEGPVYDASFSPDGSQIVTVSDDRSARTWNAAAGQEIFVLRLASMSVSASFSPDGTRILTTLTRMVKRRSGIRPWPMR